MKRRYWWIAAVVMLVLAGCDRSYRSGDRVLVAKFLYDTQLAEPRRFDVVVFKFPEKPVENGEARNYIKRLLGLPGELLAIFFGQLFRLPAPPGGTPPYFDDLADLAPEQREARLKNLWENQFSQSAEKNEKTLQWFLEGKMEAVRKPPAIMLAMRRIVYDNDYPAKDLAQTGVPARWQPRPGSAWNPHDSGKSFKHTGQSKDVDWLFYQHYWLPRTKDVELDAKKVQRQLIKDHMDYNTCFNFPHEDQTAIHWVGDLMVECQATVEEPVGELALLLSRGPFQYQAQWDLSSGVCKLFKREQGKAWEELASRNTAVKAKGSYNLRLANFDSRLTVWVDRDLPFGDGHDYVPPEVPTEEEKKLDLKNRLERIATRCKSGAFDLDEPAGVGSKGGKVSITHLRLWRDTYYTISGPIEPIHIEEKDREKWPALFRFREQNLPIFPMYVQPGHFLVLGDNSQSSYDSRNWGVVPERLLLGRALMVYYPFDRAGFIR